MTLFLLSLAALCLGYLTVRHRRSIAFWAALWLIRFARGEPRRTQHRSPP